MGVFLGRKLGEENLHDLRRKTVRLNTNKGFLFCIFQKEGKWVSQVYVHNSLFAGNIYFTTMVLS